MRPFGTVIVICMLVCNVVAASAQSYCPFLAFCGAQQGHCYGSCGAVAEVIDAARRPAWRQSCSDNCGAQYNSCAARLSPRCFDRENWH